MAFIRQDQRPQQDRTAVVIDYPQYTEQWMAGPSLSRQLSVDVTKQHDAPVEPSPQDGIPQDLDEPATVNLPNNAPVELVEGDDYAGPQTGDEPPEKPKRIRTSKPKVKTGCTQCKQRRVKCDEMRPACTRCTKARRECTGYPPLPRSARPYEQIKIAPKPLAAQPIQPAPAVPITSGRPLYPRRAQKVVQRIPTAPVPPAATTPPHTPVLYRPMAGLQLQNTEGLYFQLFQMHTANELSGYFDDLFWSRMVLQECHTEESIRHAVVALGALYKTLEQSSESPPNSPSENGGATNTSKAAEHWQVAIKQYSDACKALVVRSSQDRRPHRTLLMATVLLACFDSFVGDHQAAITQIQSGLGVLEQLRNEHKRSHMTPGQEPVEEELIQMFNRLAIQAKSYDLAFHFPEPYVIRLTPPTQNVQNGHRDPYSPPPADHRAPPPSLPDPLRIPERFTCLREARLMWDMVCERLLRFTEILMDNNTPSDVPRGILPDSIRHVGLGFKGQLEMWSASFDYLLSSRTAPGVSWQEKAGIAVLKMFQIMTQIIFLMTFSDSELPFDNFNPQFKAIVDLATEVVGDEERRAAAARCPDAPHNCRHRGKVGFDAFGDPHVDEYTASHIKPSFSADLGIVPPLFVVSTKCRDRVIRRKAIQLLRSSARREAMWDSELTARIGNWVADVEEDGADQAEEMAFAAELAAAQAQAQAQARYMSPDSPVSSGPYSGYDDGMPVGPGGNAGSVLFRRDSAVLQKQNGMLRAQQSAQKKTVPEEQRIMVKGVTFDLRSRWAMLQVGTRSKKLELGGDTRRRQTYLTW